MAENAAAEESATAKAVVEPASVDWELLHAKATEAMQRAYAPYSRFPVGVAGLSTTGG